MPHYFLTFFYHCCYQVAYQKVNTLMKKAHLVNVKCINFAKTIIKSYFRSGECSWLFEYFRFWSNTKMQKLQFKVSHYALCFSIFNVLFYKLTFGCLNLSCCCQTPTCKHYIFKFSFYALCLSIFIFLSHELTFGCLNLSGCGKTPTCKQEI